MGASLTSGAEADDGSLIRVVYASTLVAHTAELAEATIASIMQTALVNNPRRGITGVLFFNPATARVVQLLEGPPRAVYSLLSIIRTDARHHDLSVLEEGRVRKRLRDGFGMAFARVEGEHTALQMARVRSTAGHLIRLQYSSILLAASSEDGQRIIGDILTRAILFNRKARIGGLLVFNPVTCMVTQILEGPAAAVLDLFDRISADPRHRSIQLTSHELVLRPEDVQFDASWGMMQAESNDVTQEVLLGLAYRLREACEPYDGSSPMGGSFRCQGSSSRFQREPRSQQGVLSIPDHSSSRSDSSIVQTHEQRQRGIDAVVAALSMGVNGSFRRAAHASKQRATAPASATAVGCGMEVFRRDVESTPEQTLFDAVSGDAHGDAPRPTHTALQPHQSLRQRLGACLGLRQRRVAPHAPTPCPMLGPM